MDNKTYLVELFKMEFAIIGGALCLAAALRNSGKNKISRSDEMISRLCRAILGNLGGIFLFKVVYAILPEKTDKQKFFKAKYGTLLAYAIPASTFMGAMFKDAHQSLNGPKAQ